LLRDLHIFECGITNEIFMVYALVEHGFGIEIFMVKKIIQTCRNNDDEGGNDEYENSIKMCQRGIYMTSITWQLLRGNVVKTLRTWSN
jgi:hypothetical protein